MRPKEWASAKPGAAQAKNAQQYPDRVALSSPPRQLARLASSVPAELPKLKRGDDLIPDIPNDAQVARILELSSPSQRRAFLLMAYAGLRPNEVRALENRNVRLNSNKAEPHSGFIWVREGESYGERHSPKTGQRHIPIGGPLLDELAQATGSPETCVALTAQGRPWAQWGLYQAFLRACCRAKIEGFTVYSLRHYSITLWLRAGVPVHVVQRMAGHKHLATTARYIHLLRGDLDDAAVLIGNITCWQQPHLPLPLRHLLTQRNVLSLLRSRFRDSNSRPAVYETAGPCWLLPCLAQDRSGFAESPACLGDATRALTNAC